MGLIVLFHLFGNRDRLLYCRKNTILLLKSKGAFRYFTHMFNIVNWQTSIGEVNYISYKVSAELSELQVVFELIVGQHNRDEISNQGNKSFCIKGKCHNLMM